MKYWVIEGNYQRLDGGAMFGNVPKELWKKWVQPDDNNRIKLACKCLLLQDDNNNYYLFDTGVGNFFDTKLLDRYGIEPPNDHLLLSNLKKIGVNPSDISHIILSHLHFDHVGGLVQNIKDQNCSKLKISFPNAKIYISRSQWDRALRPHIRDKASYIKEINDLILESGKLVLVNDDCKPTPHPNISFMISNGHTPGLLVSFIDTKSHIIVFASDLIPASNWIKTTTSMGYDRYAELVIDEKIELLKKISNKNYILFLNHDPNISFVKILSPDNNQFDFQVIDS